MLKKVRLRNFESHEDSEIEFTNGFNLLVGESNSGKTSIIRALDLVCSNSFNKDSVRNGHRYCEVYLENDIGWVECRRGEGINEWRCFDGSEIKEFKAIGAGVPEEVGKILGLGERRLGGIKEKPNFMFQLEKHYLLSEVDGKKATSNLVARLMDNAIGLGGMEDLIKNLASDLSKAKKALTKKQEEIDLVKAEMIDDSLFSRIKGVVDQSRSLFEEVGSVKRDYEVADSFVREYKHYLELLKETEKSSLKDFDLDYCIGLLSDIEHLTQQNEKLIRFEGEYKSLLSTLKMIKDNGLLDFDIDACMLELYAIENFDRIYSSYNDIMLVFNALKGVDLDIESFFSLYNDIYMQYELYLRLEELKNSYFDTLALHDGLSFCVENFENDVSTLEYELDELKNELGVCPLCGGEFSGDNKHEQI